MRWNRFVHNRLALCVSSWLAAWFLRALGSTWRITFECPIPVAPDPQAGPILAAFWHRYTLIAVYLFRDRGFSAPVSRSRDGDLISAIITRLGYSAPPRGSSSSGGSAALRRLVQQLQAGTTVSIQTDGPRGPACVSKPGVVALSRLSGTPISPVGFAASSGFSFRSWDRTLLPLPFSRVLCVVAPAIPVSRNFEHGKEAAVQRAVDQEIGRVTAELNRQVGVEEQRGE